MPTLILASGYGLRSLLAWQSASGSVPESLQLDGVFEPRESCSNGASGSYPVSFLFQRSRSLWLSQALANMNSAWRLTSWCVLREGKGFLEMSGPGGAAFGAASAMRSTTVPDLTCS